MAEWSEGDLAIAETPIHYYRMGRPGGPPVVLLHGFGDAGLCWLRLARDLASDYDLVMLDAVGHGHSGGPERGFRARAVGDVLAAIDLLGLDRPALIGHSMGAATAACVAYEAPDRLRGVALEDPPWRDGPLGILGASPEAIGSRAPLRSPAWTAWMRSLKALSPEERHAMSATERPRWAEIDRTHWADAQALFNLAILDEPLDTGRPPWREVVARITCPVLLLTAEPERGAIVTVETAAEATRLWRTGRVIKIPGAGHNLRRDQYAPFSQAVTTFLRETAV